MDQEQAAEVTTNTQELTQEKILQLQQTLQKRVNVMLTSFVSNECKKYNRNPGVWLLVVDVLGSNFCNAISTAGGFLDEVGLFEQMVTEMRNAIVATKDKKIASSN